MTHVIQRSKAKTLRKNFKHFYLCKLNEDSRNPETLINTTYFKERETGLEPATPTLARSYSTN